MCLVFIVDICVLLWIKIHIISAGVEHAKKKFQKYEEKIIKQIKLKD